MKLNDNTSLKYKDVLSKYDFSNVIEKPTKHGNALQDHIIKNTIKKVSSHDVLPCQFAGGRDAPLNTINAKITRYEPRYKFIRSLKNFDFEKYKNECVKNNIFNPQHL